MSDAIKHECGIAHIRLLKPLEFYKKKYGTAFYGINKMYLIMEKQHNRGQDGAGFASIKLDNRVYFVRESDRLTITRNSGNIVIEITSINDGFVEVKLGTLAESLIIR